MSARHKYDGLCPDDVNTDTRDPSCVACQLDMDTSPYGDEWDGYQCTGGDLCIGDCPGCVRLLGLPTSADTRPRALEGAEGA